MIQVPFGVAGLVELDVPQDGLIADCWSIRRQPLDDPAAATAAAVDSPLEFPSIKQAIVPGDRVVVAIGADVPCIRQVISGLLHVLEAGAVAPEDICLLSADEATHTQLQAALELGEQGLGCHKLHARLRVSRHQPDVREALGYLAADRQSRPLYFNRDLLDADVVIPVGVLRCPDSWQYAGVHGALYPAFCDTATCAAEASRNRLGDRQSILKSAGEAAWLIGTQFTVQILPGPGDSVLQVLAGECAAVEREGERLCELAWRHSIRDRGQLVVATIEGAEESQTWDNVARAVFVAKQAAADAADIVLCTELSDDPLAREPTRPTAAPAEETQEASARELAVLSLDAGDRRVYLLSHLPDEVVERLGAAPLGEPADVLRMSRRSPSCVLIRNAHRTTIQVASPTTT